jgi:hypothetical protein
MWFFKKKNDRAEHLNDEMRAKALETRRLQHQIAQLEKRLELKGQLDNLSEIANGGSGNKMEDMMLMMLANAFINPQKQVAVPTSYTEGNTSFSPQNVAIAQTLSKHIPPQYMEALVKTPDNDLLEIRRAIVQIKQNAV